MSQLSDSEIVHYISDMLVGARDLLRDRDMPVLAVLIELAIREADSISVIEASLARTARQLQKTHKKQRDND